MADQTWDSNAISLLVNATRELKFDWNAIAKKLSTEVTHLTVTPAVCRQQYAKEYSKNAKEDTASVVVQATPPAAVEPDKAEIWENFDKMSLEELIDHVDKKELEMNARKEAIFQRVLNSLGSSEDATQLSAAITAEMDEVKKKYFDAVQQKELDKLNKQQQAYDQQEKLNIEKERQKLKKRFDADSVDNIGENPLGDVGTSSTAVGTSVAAALSANDSAALAQLLGNREVSGSAADQQLFASLLKSGTVGPPAAALDAVADLSTDLEGILVGEQFDILLSEIEKELDSQSQDKVEEEPSELFEVLSMLENAAKQKKKSTGSASDSSKAKAPSTSAASSAANVASSAEYLSVFGSKSTSVSSGNPSAGSKAPAKETKPQTQSASRRLKPVDEQSDSEDSDDESEEDDDVSGSRGSSRKTSPVKPPSLLIASKNKSTEKEVEEEDESSESETENNTPATVQKVSLAPAAAAPASKPIVVSGVSGETSATKTNSVKPEPIPEVLVVDPGEVIPPVEEEDSSAPAAVSQVTGSLTGTSAGGSRRVKGKLGSIMSNTASRGATVTAAPAVHPYEVSTTVEKSAVVDTAADVKHAEPPKTFIRNAAVSSPAVSVAPVKAAVLNESLVDASSEAVVVPPTPPLTHCTMDPITGAPVLSTLNLTDKSGNAPVYQISIAQGKLAAEFNSDVPLALVLQWLFKILRGNDTYKPMKICGLQTSSSVVVTEGVAPHSSSGCKCTVTVQDSLSEEGGFSVADFSYLCSSTSLSSVGVEVCSVDLRMLKEFVSVSAVNDAVSLTAGSAVQLNNAIVSESSHPTVGSFLSDDNVVVSCMKDYVLEEHGLLEFVSDPEVARDGLLFQYFTAAEVGGLRLAGMRLVYLEQKYIEFGNYKMFISQPVQSFVHTSYEGPRPPLVGVWCFAFYSGSLGASVARQGKPSAASTGVLAVSRSVADTLRAIHGPDDCILAVRTDPLSMRARFGCKSANSRIRNIFYNIPFAADKIKAELRFWFGARANPPFGSEPSLSLLSYNQQKRLLVGVSLDSSIDSSAGDETAVCTNNKVLSELQYAVYNAVSDALNNSANKFTSLQVLAKPSFRLYFPQASVAPGLSVLIEYESNASSVYLSSMEAVLNQSVQQATAAVVASNRRSSSGSEVWKSDVFLSLAEAKDQTSALPQQTGSQLAFLEVLKVVPDSHYRSHEDVGLSDTCLVTLQSKDSSQLSATQVADSLVVALVKLMHQFPITCRVTLIACKTVLPTEIETGFVVACLRGYQILENIDHCVSSVSESSGVSVRVIKGKRCLSELLLEFNMANVYVEGAVRDRAMYIPEGTVVVPSGSNPACDGALALFPPGHFVNTAVLLFPIVDSHPGSSTSSAATAVNSNVTLTRNLARVANKLEKENFELLDILVTSDNAISEALLSQLRTDNFSEYSYSSSTESVKPVKNYVAMVVRKNAALFKLKSLLGPVFSDDFAVTSYPHSIAAHFAGGATSTSGGSSSVVLYPTLTISSVHKTITEVFASGNKAVSRSMTELYSQISSLQSLNSIHHNADSDAHSEASHGDAAASVTRSAAYFESRLFQCSSSHSLTTSPQANSVLAKSSDIAAIVVTYRLIQQNGLGTILEALHREGLSVVNVYVTTVSHTLAKTLLDLTGASSLSLKPSLAHLTQGPAVILGLEGPSHALIRLKSFGVAAKSTRSLWALDGFSNTSGGAGTEWGIVASSSSRLAKDLYAYCFDRIHCSNSVFSLVDAAKTSSEKA